MESDKYNLNRFIVAQERDYPIALNELKDDAREVFGSIDAMKLRSSMTLFDIISPNDVFARVLDKYFGWQRDNRTIRIIKSVEKTT